MVGLMGWGVPAEQGRRKGLWTPEEDKLLSEFVSLHGEGRWSYVARSAGLNRNGKSCRLRWVNYLRPGLKKSQITPQEEGIIIELHALWGNKWSTIARYLPGRTDNEIKNYWRTHFKKKPKHSQSQKQEKRKTHQVLQQKHLLQEEKNDMKNLSPNADLVSNETMAKTQDKEMIFMFPPIEYQGLPVPAVMHQDFGPNTEDGLWGGLWNLDGRVDYMSNDCNKMAIQNQATAYSCRENAINWFDEGYIF